MGFKQFSIPNSFLTSGHFVWSCGVLSSFYSSVALMLPMPIAAKRHEPRQNHQLHWQALLPRDEGIERDSVQPSGFLRAWYTDLWEVYGVRWTLLDNLPVRRQLSRHYPKDFGVAVASLVAKQPPVADLRNKEHVDPMLTDREIFSTMPMGDVWWDAKLPELYWYLRQLPTLSIPESWSSAIQQFEQELQEETHTHHELFKFLKCRFASCSPHHVFSLPQQQSWPLVLPRCQLQFPPKTWLA